jgi:hypothetical protein
MLLSCIYPCGVLQLDVFFCLTLCLMVKGRVIVILQEGDKNLCHTEPLG